MMGRHTKQVKYMTRHLPWVLLLGYLLLLCGCGVPEEPVDYKNILSRVHAGDRREQVLRALSDAWYHSECSLFYGGVEDIFLYGPKERDSVTIISVLFRCQGETRISARKCQRERLVVVQAGIYENYFLDRPDFGEYCQPPVQKAFEQDQTREIENQ